MNTKLLKLSVVFAVGQIAAVSAQAQISVTSQSVHAGTQGFCQGPTGFDAWNHGSTNSFIGDMSVSDSDSRTVSQASAQASALSSITYLSNTPTLLHYVSDQSHGINGSAGINSSALASGFVQLGLTFTTAVNYDITMHVYSSSNFTGGAAFYSSTGIIGGTVVGTYHFTGTLAAGSYFMDHNNASNDSIGTGSFNWGGHSDVNARFYTVPEPSSLIALGLGGFALIRRRKV